MIEYRFFVPSEYLPKGLAYPDAGFENAGAGGEAIVQLIHDFASPGWEQRASFPDFPSWLEWAKPDD